jgi:hypothetical protein
MTKITVVGTMAAVLVAAAGAREMSVGALYAPGKVAGYVDESREYSEKEFSPAGLKGRVSLGLYEDFYAALSLGYNDFVYREEGRYFPETPPVTSIPMFITTLGAEYNFHLGPFAPYAGGGAAFACEVARAYGQTAVDWYPGVYAEGGARYHVGDGLALVVAPRFTQLFDRPVIYYDGFVDREFVRADHRTRLTELLVGFDYYF